MSVLWVVDLRVDPGSLVVRVVNLLGFPLTLQRQHKKLGLAVVLVILDRPRPHTH